MVSVLAEVRVWRDPAVLKSVTKFFMELSNLCDGDIEKTVKVRQVDKLLWI